MKIVVAPVEDCCYEQVQSNLFFPRGRWRVIPNKNGRSLI